ncbi:MAG: hypothetical protein LBT41_04945 [Candidatus Methanoplasma sp.]|jgi:hypothetical protein|nr:hypothetical protein [Candidatus Methanoplasma sp.]
MEWTIGETEFILEISLSDLTGKMATSEDDEKEIEFDLSSESGWNELNEMLRTAAGTPPLTSP